jgi:hypothetical protein
MIDLPITSDTSREVALRLFGPADAPFDVTGAVLGLPPRWRRRPSSAR